MPVSRRWVLGGVAVSTTHLCTTAAAGTLAYQAISRGLNDDPPSSSLKVGGPSGGLRALTLSAAPAYGRPLTATINGATPGSSVQIVTNLVPGSTGSGLTVAGRTLTGTPGARSFLLRETLNGVSRDTLIFAPENRAHTMPVGMGTAGLSYYTKNNVFIDNLKYAGWLTSPATMDANGMPLTLAPGPYGPAAALLLYLEPGKHRIVTDGDMGFTGWTKEGADYVRTIDTAGVFMLAINRIGRAPTRMACVRDDEAAAFRSGEIFKPGFLADVRTFRWLRTMNWLGGNFDNPVKEMPNSLLYTPFGVAGGVPLSIVARLCRQTGTALWLNIHVDVTAAAFASDYVPVLDDLVAHGVAVYLEYSNEVWNTQFGQYRKATKYAQDAGYSGNPFLASTWWVGVRTAELAKASRGKGYRWLVGVQTVQQAYLKTILEQGMATVPGHVDGDIHGWIVTFYIGGTLSLGFTGALGTAMDGWVATRNFDAVLDNTLNYTGPAPGAFQNSAASNAATFWKEARDIATAKGWKLFGYEGALDYTALPYSRNIATYSPFMYDIPAQPMAKPAIHQLLETTEAIGFDGVTMFDYDSTPNNSNFGRYGLKGLIAFDALTEWNRALPGGTGPA